MDTLLRETVNAVVNSLLSGNEYRGKTADRKYTDP